MQINNPQSLNGIDISQFQGFPNFLLVNNFAKFMWHRIASQSTGVYNPDDNFLVNIPAAQAQGIPVGGYLFAGINTGSFAEAELQADNFIADLESVFGAGQYGDLFPVLDFEAGSKINGALTTDQLLEWVEHFIEYFQDKTGRKMLLYTAEFFAQTENDFSHSTRGHILAKYPLWVAFYLALNPEDRPNNFGGWTEWRAWQYSATGSVSGIAGNVDLDYGPDHISQLMPPIAPIGLTALPDSGAINLHWDETDEVDIKGWHVFINNVKVDFVTNISDENEIISYSATGLINGTQYKFGIQAEDDDGDLSPISEVFATPQEQLLRITWTAPSGETITFGGQRKGCKNDFGFIIQDFSGESSTQVVEQTQKAPFQVGVSLFNVDVAPRVLTMSGKIMARNRTELFTMRKQLVDAFAFEPDREFEALELFTTGIINYFQPTPEGEKTLFIEAIPRQSPQLTMIDGVNNMVDFDIEWFCPGTYFKDTTLLTQFLPDDGGLQFPIEFPIEFAALSDQVVINNPGDVSSPITITIFGEMTNPTIRNLTTGKSITLLTTILGTEQVKIFTEFGQKRIIKIVGGVETNFISALALTDADFWGLAKGNNTVEFVADSNPTGKILIEFFPRFAGV